MEWLKRKSLKQSFFIISILFLCGGLFLSAASFVLCVNQTKQLQVYPQYKISLEENGNLTTSEESYTSPKTETTDSSLVFIFTVFQFILPVFFVVLSLLLAGVTFYRIKLQKPLEILQNGAMRIQQQDLDFEIEKCAEDELGMLCDAFEKMRTELLNNNRRLWWQMEERKRLNAAFSHDLRNPVTVLKGSAKMARLGVQNETATTEQLLESLTRIEAYTDRIESYVETMSHVQRLEQIPLRKKQVAWDSLVTELENLVQLLGHGSEKEIDFTFGESKQTILLDSDMLSQITENLLANALRFSNYTIHIFCTISENELKLTVADDGSGFSPALIKNGIQPFQKGSEQPGHFGMGLYICKLLCQKHGGNLEIGSSQKGAAITAVIKITDS